MSENDQNPQKEKCLFDIPEPSLKELHFCEKTMPSFQQWLDRLPLLDPNKLVDPVLNAVSQLAALDAKGMQLFNFVSRLNETLNIVHKLLEKRYQKRIQDQSDIDKKALEIAHKLDSRLLIIYQRILSREPLSMNQRGESTFRAMECLLRITLRCGFLYLATPKGVWSKLHQLFQYAEDQSLFVKSFNCQHPGQEKLSIMNLYLQVLLIKCCHPKQLQTNQLQELFDRLPAMADAVKFGPVDKLRDSLYVVDTCGTKPPLYRDPELTYADHMHGLDVYPIIQDLEGKLDSSNLASKISPDLAFQLKRIWSQRPVRIIERIDSSQSVKLVIGFSAIFQRLAREQIASEFVKIHFPSSGITEDLSNKPRDTKTFMPIRAQLVNVSASKGGLGLTAKKFPQQLNSGELIMILGDEETFFGVVRWVELNTLNDINFGVELLATAIQPVVIQSFTQNKTWTSLAPAFIVSQGVDGDDEPYLIAPKTETIGADAIRMFTRTQEIFVKFEHTRIMTGVVIQGTFKQISSNDLRKANLKRLTPPKQKLALSDETPVLVINNHELTFTDFELDLEKNTTDPITALSIDNEGAWSSLYIR